MKAIMIVVLLVITCAVINYMRAGHYSGPLPQVLPFLGGDKISFHDLSGLVCIGIAIWGLTRLFRNHDED
ncbi:MAG: hypothetical protein IH624_13915 [Phycisphaerae bacterium]|nr:hypothetical protein [Phycisphaerae bacterium]